MGEGTSKAEERVVGGTESREGAAGDRAADREVPLGAGPERRQPKAGRPRSLLSPDESWWWNGRRWVSAKTEDGLWAWNGARWRTTVELEGKPAEELAEALVSLADERRTDAGALLATRAAEWQPEGELRELVARAEDVALRLQHRQEAPTVAHNRRLLGRRSAPIGESHVSVADRAALSAQQRTLHAQIGRLAPHPTVKEADDALAAARLLDEGAALLGAALAEVHEAERIQGEVRAAARRELAAAETARQEAIRRAERGLDQARSAHTSALTNARDRFRATLNIGKGELEAGLGRLHLHSRVLTTPSGALPAAALAAFQGTAPTLWRDHRELLADLVLLELPETASFLTALITGSDTLFLLFKNRTGAALWVCPTGQEVAAKRFLSTLRDQAQKAAAAAEEGQARTREAEQHLDALARDRSSVEAAEAQLGLVQTDHGLLAAIDQARQKLQEAETAIPQLVEANKKVSEAVTRLLTPPEALAPRPGEAAH
jgi:hypothetical protein